MKDVIEELESEHCELWNSCQRDRQRRVQLIQEIRKECAQCVNDYKTSIAAIQQNS